jgi:hypothetical protein
MRNLRSLLLVASGMVFAACATQTFRPDEAPEYVVTGKPTPFYLGKPKRESVPDASLSVQTRVKLLRKQSGYSLVLLEDSRQGYVSNAYITRATPGSEQRSFGSPAESAPTPKRKKRVAPGPTPAPIQSSQTPASEATPPPASAPTSPEPQVPPGEAPSPTPPPEAPLEKPKFRL